MFWKAAREEVRTLKGENEQAIRDREAARLNLRRSLKKLSDHLGTIPIDEGLGQLAESLAPKREGDGR